MGDSFPKIYAFRDIAKFYDEEGEFDQAIAVCETARQYQIEDGTKTGFSGRIERIQKNATFLKGRATNPPKPVRRRLNKFFIKTDHINAASSDRPLSSRTFPTTHPNAALLTLYPVA